ncbi:hypothetical protein [Azospirillum sp. sgz301742]
MKRWVVLAAVAGLLVSGNAGATLIKKGDGKAAGATAGGVGVSSSSGNRVRVQCWQDGRRVVDESDLAMVSLSIANQFNGLGLRRTSGPDGTMTVVMTPARTACLLSPHD